MQITKRAAGLGVAAITTALVLSGCAGGSDSGSGSGDPIVVASVNALSGGATFPEASAAAKAVFDQFNAEGGLNGRMIEYTVLDDKGDASAASAAARDAVESDNAVAMVGSASLVDCQVNADYYEQSGIVSIQGTGIDPFCFSTPNISPVNSGPYLGTQLTLSYGSEILGLKKICGLLSIAGATRPAYQQAFDNWTADTGQTFELLDDTVPYGAPDFTPYVVKAKEAGCDGIYTNGAEPDVVGVVKAAQAQGMTDVTFLALTSIYSEQFAAQASFIGKGIYVPAEFAPYTDTSNAANADWTELMTSADVPLTSFAQGGYLAAENFITMLKSIDGDVTRESVTAAFKAQTEGYESPMVGTPWIFGPGDAHSSNQAGWPVTVQPGSTSWATLGDDWITAETFTK